MPTVSSSVSFRRYDDNIDLSILEERARHWIEHILDEKLGDDKPLSDLLADGLILERLGEKVQTIYRMKFGAPEDALPQRPKTPSRSWGTKVHWDAIAHVASFLKVCKEVGLTDVHLCTPQDVVDQKNPRNVYLCVRTLAIRLFHVKVTRQEFEPVEKANGDQPPIYQAVSEDDGEGKVGSVVRRIDEGIFNYPSIKVREWDDEYDDDEDEDDGFNFHEAEERRLSEYNSRTMNNDFFLKTPPKARVLITDDYFGSVAGRTENANRNGDQPEEHEDGSTITTQEPGMNGGEQPPPTDQGGDVQSTATSAPSLSVEGSTSKKSSRQRRLRSLDQSHENGKDGSESSAATKNRTRSKTPTRGRRSSASAVSSSDESGLHGDMAFSDSASRPRRRRSQNEYRSRNDDRIKRVDSATSGNEVRVVVRSRGQMSKGKGAQGAEPFWKSHLQRLQELPRNVIIAGAAAATGAAGALLFLLLRPKRTIEYKVQKGDCLIQIAQKVRKKNWEEIYNRNPDIKDPDLIHPEVVLKL